MSKINKTTLQNALGVLDAQLTHVNKCETMYKFEKQNAYYKGMRDMLEIILTDYYTNKNELYRHSNLEHSIHTKNGDVITGKTFCVLSAGKALTGGE